MIKRTLAVAALALVTLAFAGQDGTVIRRTLTENSTETYKVKAKLGQTMDIGGQTMAIDMSLQSTIVVKTSTVDAAAGIAKVSVTTKVDSIDADGPMADQIKEHIPKATTVAGTIDRLGAVKFDTSKLSASEAMASVMAAGSQAFSVQLPDKAVKIGDTWDVIIPKGPSTYPTDQKITAKLTGEQKLGDKDAWVISIEGTIKNDLDMSKFSADEGAQGPTDTHITSTTKRSAKVIVEKATGKVLHLDETDKSNAHIEIPSASQSFEGTSSSTTSIDLG